MSARRAPFVRGALTAIVMAALTSLPACTHHKKDAKKPFVDTTTTTGPDLSQVVLAGVKGTTSTTVPGTPGKASITGRVIDTAGASVPGATVRAEWFVTDKPVSTDVQTGDDGVYTLPAVHGGVWRVRAFRAPDHATDENPTFFLGATEQKKLDIKVATITGFGVTSNIAPNPPVVNGEAELAVLYAQQTVDAEGRVVRTPVAGVELQLTGSGHWSLPAGSSTKFTDAKGTAKWRLVCRSEGQQSLAVQAPDRSYDLTIPACVAEETTTTGAPSSSTSSTRSGSTTTTRSLTPTTRGP